MPPDSAAQLFAWIFLLCALLTAGLRLWLSLRQARHIAGHRDRVPVDFTDRITLAEHQKAADYSVAKIRLSWPMLAVELLLLLALTLGGGLEALDRFWAGVFAGRGPAYGLALFGSVSLIGFAIDLPFALYRTFGLEARFGFNKMTAGLFIADLFKQALLGILIGAPLLLAVFWLMTAMGRLWWLYVWAFWLSFSLLAWLLYPTLIAPLFNKFSPLADGPLKQRIEALLERCGFLASGLFVMDGSKRSAHGNAYFTGLGRSKRIVFYDTLIEKLSPAEVEAVLAHELGHFRHRHILKRLALMAASGLVLLWGLDQLIAAPWFYRGLGVSTPSMAMALLLFSQALSVFLFPLTPIGSWWSRRHEYQADAYAARHAAATELISALVKLYRDNAATLTPDPLHSLFYDSHPPAGLRIGHLRRAGANDKS